MSLISTKKIVLDFYNKNIVTVNAKQHDTQSRYINIACTDNSKKVHLDGKKATAFLRYTKNDGNIIFNQEDILDDGTILVELTEQVLAVIGKHELEIVLVSLADMSSEELDNIYAIYENGSTVISTMTFYLNVMPIMADVSSIASTEEYTSLSRALTSLTYLAQLTQTLEDTQEAIANADEATTEIRLILSTLEEVTKAADTASKAASKAAEECQVILDNNEVVYTNTKGKPNGVASLNADAVIYPDQISEFSLSNVLINDIATVSGKYALDAYQGYLFHNRLKTLENAKPQQSQNIHYNNVVDDSIGENGDILLVPLTSEGV